MADIGVEAVLIGNAAAALQGAPVTTVDFDFLFRRSSRSVAKLKKLARALETTLLRPYYPASDLFRIMRESDGLQVDFMGTIHGIRSFEGLRDRASVVRLDDTALRVASLDDIIRSKRAAGRAIAPCSTRWRKSVKKPHARRAHLKALRAESERVLVEAIRRRLGLPPHRRTNFLRKRVSVGRTAL